MVGDVPLRLRGFSPGAHREIEPHLGQAQEAALLDNGGGFLGEFDDLGGSMPVFFLFAHPIGVTALT